MYLRVRRTTLPMLNIVNEFATFSIHSAILHCQASRSSAAHTHTHTTGFGTVERNLARTIGGRKKDDDGIA